MSGAGRFQRLLRGVRVYAVLARMGLVAPRRASAEPLVVHQAVVFSDRGVLLSVRSDLQGWELPGGNPEPGESGEDALRREVLEETGLSVGVERVVGDYVRTGFMPHTARVYRCRAEGGKLRPSSETPQVRWFPLDAIPDTLFPWYRDPLADALPAVADPVTRRERLGLGAVLAGMWIDLRMRVR